MLDQKINRTASGKCSEYQKNNLEKKIKGTYKICMIIN